MKRLSLAGLSVVVALLLFVVMLSPAPAGAAVTGPCTVSGLVLDFAGNPAPRTWVELSIVEAGAETWIAAALTNDAGAFVLEGVPETNAGVLAATVGAATYRSSGHRFSESGPNLVVLRPGRIEVRLQLHNDSSWRPPFLVETWGARGGAETWIEAAHGDAAALAPDCAYAVAYPYNNQGIEWFGPAIAVTPGVREGSITFNQAQARMAWFSSPRWHSGAPGTWTKVAFSNWPAGYSVGFSGTATAPDGQTRTWPAITTSGHATFSRSFQIPSTAPAGYTYEFHVLRQDGGSHLDLTLRFQTASLIPSRTSVSKGGSVRLSGVVPVQDHWGARPGKSKDVTLYARTTAAGQPSKWDAARDGWTRVGTYRANGLGELLTGVLKPRRTTWYVLRYPGDEDYFRAYSSVVKVTIR